MGGGRLATCIREISVVVAEGEEWTKGGKGGGEIWEGEG
jgi:hypothetical protein